MPYFNRRRKAFSSLLKDSLMTRLINFAVVSAFVATLAACAAQPQPQPDLTPPARKLDAKTQLETGRR
jgi:hypothetical protein